MHMHRGRAAHTHPPRVPPVSLSTAAPTGEIPPALVLWRGGCASATRSASEVQQRRRRTSRRRERARDEHARELARVHARLAERRREGAARARERVLAAEVVLVVGGEGADVAEPDRRARGGARARRLGRVGGGAVRRALVAEDAAAVAAVVRPPHQVERPLQSMHESTRSSGSHGCCVYPESFDASDDWLSSCDQCSTSERLGIRGTGSRVALAGGSFDDASSGARRSSAVLPVCIAAVVRYAIGRAQPGERPMRRRREDPRPPNPSRRVSRRIELTSPTTVGAMGGTKSNGSKPERSACRNSTRRARAIDRRSRRTRSSRPTSPASARTTRRRALRRQLRGGAPQFRSLSRASGASLFSLPIASNGTWPPLSIDVAPSARSSTPTCCG